VATSFSEIVSLCQRLESHRGRLDKRRLLAEFLRGIAPEEVEHAVAFLVGRPFPASDPRVLSVRGLPVATAAAPLAPLSVLDVAEAFASVAEASGAGARRIREERLAALVARVSADERLVLARIVGGEMRTGASEGIVLEAIAEAAHVETAAVRRAALFLGDLSAVAVLALRGGAPEWRPRSSCRSFPCWRRSPRTSTRSWPLTGGARRWNTSTTGRACRSTWTASASASGRAGSRT
jgi:DNA ligase-1